MFFNLLRTLRPIEWGLFLLIVCAPLYFHPNLGGTGLRVPNNIVIWAFAVIIACYSLYTLTKNKHVYIPRYFTLIILFPILAFFSGIISGVELSEQWTFRVLYLWGGVFFFFGLFQFRFKQGQLDRLLFIIVISGLIHALVGISQVIWMKDIVSWLPLNPNGTPTGLFQQINNQASFQVTSILLSLWLASRPFIRKGSQWTFILLLFAIASATFIVSYSGSRVGSLGLLLALPLLLISRWKIINVDRKRWLLITVVFLTSIASSNLIENNRSSLDKFHAMNAGFSGSARLGIYTIALDVIKEKPLFGHGIGSFVRVWQLAKPAFYAEHPDASLPGQRVSHPHNEVIFWLVEGGIIAVSGILILMIAVILALRRLPHSHRYAYLAFLIPITLHTQVELPFYTSSEHWFVFLVLLFVVMHHGIQRYHLNLSTPALSLIKIMAGSTLVLSLVFLSHSMVSNIEFKHHQILKDVPKGDDPFPFSMENPYFKKLAIRISMVSLLSSSIKFHLDDNVKSYAEWAEKELEYNSNIGFYVTTAQAYIYLKNEEKICSIAQQGNAIYPRHKYLIKVLKQCSKKVTKPV